MQADDPIEELTRSVSDGRSVDWDLAESGARTPSEQASVRGLRHLALIAEYHRRLHHSPLFSGEAVRFGPGGGTLRGISHPEPWGHLTLLELVSTSASGELWRAWDAWLQREVAVKFLLTLSGPAPTGPADSALLDEARALARVRHPGVVAVHGIGEHDGRVGMWIELLQGSMLEMEIERRGALPAHEVARIGLELCRALEALESAGVVHGDIQPANIVLETSGRVVLTNFGLGYRRANIEPGGKSGTLLFKSPELLEGLPPTPRSDLYALGVTLRWALTGHSPFQARTFEDLRVEAAAGPRISLAAERPGLPSALTAAIERAMAPQADARYAGAVQLAEALETASGEMSATHSRKRSASSRILAAAGVALLLAPVVLFFPRFFERRTQVLPVRFAVTAPPNTSLFSRMIYHAISPDGRLLALAAKDSTGSHRLWLRSLESLEMRPLAETENAIQPFWSPDSRFLAYFADDGKLMKLPVSGGEAKVLCTVPGIRGASWGKNGVIVLTPGAAAPLCRVSAEGGEITEIMKPDSTLQEASLRWPQFLPDGKRFLFISVPARNGNFDVYAGSIDSNARTHVMRSGSVPLCVGNKGLITMSNGRLMFQRFDFRLLKPVGEPVALGPASAADETIGQPLASVSTNGVLVQPTPTLVNTQLVWFDRFGKRQGTVPHPEGCYTGIYFSPDGSRLLTERRDSPISVGLWMIELDGGRVTRFTHGPQSTLGGAIWSPDGKRIAFSSTRMGTNGIYQRLIDGASEEELVCPTAQLDIICSWTPDGRYLLLQHPDPATGMDIWLLPMEGERKAIPYLRSKFNEMYATISPDGRWLSYSSDATGVMEMYVRSFPTSEGEHRLTVAGGSVIGWSRDSRELLLHGLDNRVWSVPVIAETTFKEGTPRFLFRADATLRPTPDGERFLGLVRSAEVEPATMTVHMNWLAGMTE